MAEDEEEEGEEEAKTAGERGCERTRVQRGAAVVAAQPQLPLQQGPLLLLVLLVLLLLLLVQQRPGRPRGDCGGSGCSGASASRRGQ